MKDTNLTIEIKKQNKLLRKEIALLKKNMCCCPHDGMWYIAGQIIHCPIHGSIDVEKYILKTK